MLAKTAKDVTAVKFKVGLPTEKELIRQIRLTNEIVWKKDQNLAKTDIDNWLSNFKGEVFPKVYENQLALWLLANFVFYNEDEVRHLCQTLYFDFIHQFIQNESPNISIEDRYKNILTRSRFYSLGKPGESSSFILYYFRQINKLPVKKFITRFDNLDNSVDTIVFVDDVALGTEKKSQASSYIETLRDQDPILKNKKIVLLTFIATSEAITFLQSKGYTVINCITLDERHKCFNTESMIFSHFTEHLENAKRFAEHYGKKVKPENPFGHHDGQFTFGFFYNTPDNTLPIFWAEENNWIPIRKRYHKNTHNKLIGFGKYL